MQSWRLYIDSGLGHGSINYCKKGAILKTRSGSKNWILFLENRLINCCKKGLTVSVFGVLGLACFRTSHVIIVNACTTNSTVNLLRHSFSFTALEPYALQNKLKPIDITRNHCLFALLGYCGLAFN